MIPQCINLSISLGSAKSSMKPKILPSIADREKGRQVETSHSGPSLISGYGFSKGHQCSLQRTRVLHYQHESFSMGDQMVNVISCGKAEIGNTMVFLYRIHNTAKCHMVAISF